MHLVNAPARPYASVALNGVPKRLRGATRQPAEPDPDHTGGGICERRQSQVPILRRQMEDAMNRILTTIFALAVSAIPSWAADTLTIYTYQSFVSDWGPGPKVKAAFEK